MVKRLLTIAALVIALSAIVAPAHAQGNGNAQGDGNGQGNGQGNGSDNSQAGGGNSSNAAASPGGGSAASKKKDKADEDLALDAVRSEDAVPLREILQSVRQRTDGRVIDAQLFSLSGDLVYEVKVMSADGHVKRFYYQAKTGRQFSPD